LSKKPYAVEHLLRSISDRGQARLKRGVLPFELGDPLGKAGIRRASLDGFDVLQLGLGHERSASERPELLGEVVNETLELAECPLLSSRVV
jgi:hypothetical protein